MNMRCRCSVSSTAGCRAHSRVPRPSCVTSGYSGYSQQTIGRHAVIAAATAFFRLLGSHALKLGFDFEANLSDSSFAHAGTDYGPQNPLSGHRFYQTDTDGKLLMWGFERAQRDPGGGPPYHPQRLPREHYFYLQRMGGSWRVITWQILGE